MIGNPPYVSQEKIRLRKLRSYITYNNFKSTEYQINTFGLFIEKGKNILKQNGLLGFIIPNYWLSTKYDKKLRKIIFQENTVIEMNNVYNVFEAAVVDTLLLFLAKGNSNIENVTTIKSIDRNLNSITDRFLEIKNKI
ncbi:MAG: Eco57I restriction-modification methylase domain-containing protein [Ignavibacteria bacterium]|nr:Eco57I restriction-modification methylase domain-containing protein [Ignavibacteria bacterium]